MVRISILLGLSLCASACSSFDSVRAPTALPELTDPLAQAMAGLFPAPMAPIEKHTCIDLDGKAAMEGRSGKACFTVTDKSESKSIMYFFPGTAEDHNSYNSMRELRQRWFDQGVDAPVVITVSFEMAWFLVGKEESSSEKAGYKEIFLNLIPELETKAKELAGRELTGDRFVLGKSQGGLNAFKLWEYSQAETSPIKIKRFAAVCPEIIDLEPYANDVQIQAYSVTHNAFAFFVTGIALESFKAYFKTNEEYRAWAPSYNPENYKGLTKEIAFASGTRWDGGGGGIGLERLRNKIRNHGGDLEFKMIELGQHCFPMAQKEAADHLAGSGAAL